MESQASTPNAPNTSHGRSRAARRSEPPHPPPSIPLYTPKRHVRGQHVPDVWPFSPPTGGRRSGTITRVVEGQGRGVVQYAWAAGVERKVGYGVGETVVIDGEESDAN